MSYSYCDAQTDYGPNPYVTNIEKTALQNPNFRTAVWTGCHLQMTVMCIPPCGEVGHEVHEDTDQLIRVEQGTGIVKIGKCVNQPDSQQNMCKGDTVFIPAGTWHNVVNIGKNALKISSVYAPPNHRRGTVHYTKADAEREDWVLMNEY